MTQATQQEGPKIEKLEAANDQKGTKITMIRKRNGSIVIFDPEKITTAIFKAARSIGGKDKELARDLGWKVARDLESKGYDDKNIPDVETVQDIVEKVLMETGHAKTAKAYILYREKRAEIRRIKAALGVEDDMKLPINSLMVLSARYLKRDENRKIIETPHQLFTRVARSIAAIDRTYGASDEEVAKTEKEFFEMITNFEFMPNSPTLMNAGTPLGQLSACFVLPVGDSIEEIFKTVRDAAIIHKSGGGTGFAFSRIRPKGDVVRSTGGIASGPISFAKVIDAATAEIKQGGKRRGANMGILRIDHPDILEFIVSKEKENILVNFNISCAVTDRFMEALAKDTEYELINPKNKKTVNRLSAKAIWNLLVTMAWKTGDPGVIFIDRINNTASNPVPAVGPVESTNPCGEQPLYPYDSCNLGSINLAKMTKTEDGSDPLDWIGIPGKVQVDWDKLKTTVRRSVHFLDNVIDANKYPIPEIENMSKTVRRIGLGVMGWADLLILMGIPYNSEEAFKLGEQIMKFITEEGRKMSCEIGKKRGSFPAFKDSIWHKSGWPAMRNSTVTTIAPTGTISIISGCSQGIEPHFAITYMRHVGESLGIGENLIEITPLFERAAIKEGWYSPELMRKLLKSWSIQKIEEIPQHIRRVFITAHDCTPEQHVKTQAAFQKYTDNAVSKTINFPATATPYDVEKAYWLAYKTGCKGITIFRDQSKSVQVITTVEREQAEEDITPQLVPTAATAAISPPPEVLAAEAQAKAAALHPEQTKLVHNHDHEHGEREGPVTVEADSVPGYCAKCN